MTFETQELSRTLGAPIALFLFTYGPDAGDVFAYTSSEDVVSYGGNDYAPVPIHNDFVIASGTLDKAAMELRLSKTLGVYHLFDVYPPSTVVTLRIFQGHVGNADFKTLWSGRIIGVKSQTDEAVFSCEPISTALRRSGLRRPYSYGCPHVLYGVECGASRPATTTNFVVQTTDSPFVTLPDGWADAPTQQLYVNGDAVWTNSAGHVERRSILSLSSSTEIQLDGDFGDLPNGTTIALSLGCDHTTDGCNIHSNILNFGGCKWIPLTNPIGLVNNYV